MKKMAVAGIVVVVIAYVVFGRKSISAVSNSSSSQLAYKDVSYTGSSADAFYATQTNQAFNESLASTLSRSK